jgi:hypothetical protein
MRFLRGPVFVVACILAVAIGVGLGSGWFKRAATNIEQSPVTLGVGAPPGPMRMTGEEYARYRSQHAIFLDGKVPELTDLFSLLRDFDFRGDCQRLYGPARCQIEDTTPFFRALLAESDPKIEALFLVRDRPAGKPYAETIRTAFILGKDGRMKIIVETPGEVRELTALVVAGDPKEERRIAFRLLDRSTRKDMRDYPWEPKSFGVYIADDPGELKRLAGGGPASLVLQDAGGKTLSKVTITPGLEQRHRFFAAVKEKS